MAKESVIEKSLRYSFFDGIFANIMIGCTETFIVPYAIAMKASAAVVGMLVALPNLAGALVQIKSAALAERMGSRKALITASVFIHALMWLPILAIPYLFRSDRAIYLILFYTMLMAIGQVSLAPWSSLMADHIPVTERGRVFGWRNRILGLVNIGSMLGAGLILHFTKKSLCPNIFLGFTIIFSAAFISRLISWKFLTKMYEPPLEIKPEHRFTIVDFLKRIGRSNFGRFVIFVAMINFAVYLSAPFFAVYMLRDLRFSYLTYTIITLTATLTIFVMMSAWGKHADHVGNRRVLRLTSYFLPFIPVLWLFSHNVAYLIAIQIFGGFFWAGFSLSVQNFMYDAVSPEKRTRCIAYFNTINGMAISLGAVTGGFLIKVLPPIFENRLLAIFLLSGIIRILALPLFSTIKEVRKVKHISNLELFYSIMTARPTGAMYSPR